MLLLLTLLSACAAENKAPVPDVSEEGTEEGQEEEESDPNQDQQPPDGQKTITTQELAAHDEEGDCWIVYEGKVYDFTRSDLHPNMAKAFWRHCGKLSGFEEGAKDQHASSSKERVSSFGQYVGELS